MISERQEKILRDIVEYYLDTAEPISSNFLKEKSGFEVSPATIRNDLQDLMEKGYISQPHTSAGRVPTPKAYRYFVEITEGELPQFIIKEIEEARKKIEQELEAARKLEQSLKQISSTLSYTKIEDKNGVLEIMEILGPSRNMYDRHMELIRNLLKELEDF